MAWQCCKVVYEVFFTATMMMHECYDFWNLAFSSWPVLRQEYKMTRSTFVLLHPKSIIPNNWFKLINPKCLIPNKQSQMLDGFAKDCNHHHCLCHHHNNHLKVKRYPLLLGPDSGEDKSVISTNSWKAKGSQHRQNHLTISIDTTYIYNCMKTNRTL